MGIVPQARPLGGPVGAQWRLLEAWESFLFPRAIIVATHCVPVAALGFHFAALGSIFATLDSFSSLFVAFAFLLFSPMFKVT